MGVPVADSPSPLAVEVHLEAQVWVVEEPAVGSIHKASPSSILKDTSIRWSVFVPNFPLLHPQGVLGLEKAGSCNRSLWHTSDLFSGEFCPQT